MLISLGCPSITQVDFFASLFAFPWSKFVLLAVIVVSKLAHQLNHLHRHRSNFHLATNPLQPHRLEFDSFILLLELVVNACAWSSSCPAGLSLTTATISYSLKQYPYCYCCLLVFWDVNKDVDGVFQSFRLFSYVPLTNHLCTQLPILPDWHKAQGPDS